MVEPRSILFPGDHARKLDDLGLAEVGSDPGEEGLVDLGRGRAHGLGQGDRGPLALAEAGRALVVVEGREVAGLHTAVEGHPAADVHTVATANGPGGGEVGELLGAHGDARTGLEGQLHPNRGPEQAGPASAHTHGSRRAPELAGDEPEDGALKQAAGLGKGDARGGLRFVWL